MVMSLDELPRDTRVFLVARPVDGRTRYHGLCEIVREACGGNPPFKSLWVFPPKGRQGLLRAHYWNGRQFIGLETELAEPAAAPWFREISLSAFRRLLAA